MPKCHRRPRRRHSSSSSEEEKESKSRSKSFSPSENSSSNSDEKEKPPKSKPKKPIEHDSSSDSEKEFYNSNNNNNNNNPKDLTKCYICLNISTDPVICRFCGNISCKKCLNSWIRNNNKCGCCRKQITKNDIISLPILKNINNCINEITEEKNHEICSIHNEKILFFCMKCLKKYCGKCLFFGSEEAKKHEGHNIIDYAELKKSEYNSIINNFDKYRNTKKEIEELDIKNNTYKNEIKYLHENSKNSLDYCHEIIEKKLQEKINIISNHSIKLQTEKNNLDNKYNNIFEKLSKLEKIDKKIENFDCVKSESQLLSNISNINDIKNQINDILRSELKINLSLNHSSFIQTYQDILKTKDNENIINNPQYLKLKLIKLKEKENVEKEYLKVILLSKNEKSFFIHLFITHNNKIYYFQRDEESLEIEKENPNLNNNISININPIKKEDIELNHKEEIIFENKEKIINKETRYVAYIPKEELNEGNNSFYYTYYRLAID